MSIRASIGSSVSRGVKGSIRDGGTSGLWFDLTLPVSFGVTLQRDENTYRVPEVGTDFLGSFNGTTIYINADTGDDVTGDGTIGSPYETLSKAMTEAVDDDRISMAPGEYATVSMSKDVAWLAPSGGAYIGTFNDLSGATITEIDNGGRTYYQVDAIGGQRVVTLIQKDNVVDADGFAASVFVETTTTFNDYYDKDIGCVEHDTGLANVFLKGGASLITEVAAGNILAVLEDATTRPAITSGTNGYIGPGITISNNAVDVVVCSSTVSSIVLDRCHIYGGSDACFSIPGVGNSKLFGVVVGGSQGDNLDYRGTSINSEVDIVSKWPGRDQADNASTGHDDCKVLRVGGKYQGGSRTVHDVHDTHAFNFSITIGDAIHVDQMLQRNGSSISSGETVALDYGDITYLDSFGEGFTDDTPTPGNMTKNVFDSEATIINTELTDPWHYGVDSPDDLPNLVLWFDADRSVTDTITDTAGAVDQWDDKSDSAINATAADGKRPDTDTFTVGGVNVVDFDGSNDEMDLSSTLTLPDEWSMYVLADNETLAGFNFFLGSETEGTKFGTSGTNIFARVVDGGSSDSTQATTGDPAIHVYTRDSDNKVDYALNGDTVARLFSDAAQAGDTNLNLLGGNNGSTHYRGRIGEVIIYNQYHDAVRRQLVLDYLATKFTITL